MSKKIKKIVCLGGGTGVSVLLSGLKKNPVNLTAIVTMFDTGGSSGRLKKELKIPPLGDIRQCFTALTSEKEVVKFFNYRFDKGWLKGHNLGNLIIAAAIKMADRLEQGLGEIMKILNIKKGIKIFPISLENADIIAELKNNEKIYGEENIINCRYLSKTGIKKLYLKPKVSAYQKAISAIKKADLIIFAPGKFYTSILPNLLVKGIPKAIRDSHAKKVFICNLMTQPGNTDGFVVEDFVKELEQYLGKNVIDYVIFNTGKLPKNKLREAKEIFPKADFVKYDKKMLKRKNFIGKDVLDYHVRKLNPKDILVKEANQRTIIFHNPNKLTKIILDLCKQ